MKSGGSRQPMVNKKLPPARLTIEMFSTVKVPDDRQLDPITMNSDDNLLVQTEYHRGHAIFLGQPDALRSRVRLRVYIYPSIDERVDIPAITHRPTQKTKQLPPRRHEERRITSADGQQEVLAAALRQQQGRRRQRRSTPGAQEGVRRAEEEGGAREGPAGKEAAFGISDDTVVVEMDTHGHYYGDKEFPYDDKFMAKARDRYDKHVQERTDRRPFVLKFQDD
ncbi:hypothetical protein TRIUR3_26494 [Triticum urartu]|uniref:Uncharacterized protein n=1 Tax=Triticum urartu TaxID=4572 RepID=M7ZFJ8_TRIUA|nr:hypothetical protein TRIUR3_26494 [Triticum urartu]